MLLKLLICVGLIIGAAAGCARVKPAPPTVVPHVDLQRYAGTWYEIARYPNRFEKDCIGARAKYTVLDDDSIEVINECYKDAGRKKLSSVKGKGRVVDKETNAKLKVTFFWPFSGDYWIIDLGQNYEYAVIGHPKRRYLWILSRTPEIDDALYERILKRLQEQLYDVSRLVRQP